MNLNPDEYEGLRSFQVLTPAQKKRFLFLGKILQFFISTTKRKEAKKPEIIAIYLMEKILIFYISLFKATKDFQRKKLRIITSIFWNLGIMTIF